jgi:hypothetical protein
MELNKTEYQNFKTIPFLRGPGMELKSLITKNILEINQNELRILDVGFNDPGSFILFHHLFGIQKYKGIDIITSPQFNLSINFESSRPEEILNTYNSSPYERYGLFFKYVINKHEDNVSIKMEESSFNKIFQFHFETTIQDCIKRDLVSSFKPNFIVLSDFLHLLKDKNEANLVYDNLLNHLALGGFIMIKVYNSKCEGSSERFPYTPDDIESIKSKIDVIYESTENDKTTIVGRKK